VDIREHNRLAWDRLVENRNRWTVPAEAEEIAAARRGLWSIVLTPNKNVPHDWLPDLSGCRTLCLASGGGQQGPILAAAGAEVTVLDNSPKQLEHDRSVAEREGLSLETVEGDMADLSAFPDERFEAIVNPVSNCFVPDVRPVWREAYRVLRGGGVLIAGFANPAEYLFDYAHFRQARVLEVRHALPYSDLERLSDEEKRRYEEERTPFEFGHTLTDQIGGQIAAGFVITGFYEDYARDVDGDPLNDYMPGYIATRALKPRERGD
jgi:SAM-dependent methyltransferase